MKTKALAIGLLLCGLGFLTFQLTREPLYASTAKVMLNGRGSDEVEFFTSPGFENCLARELSILQSQTVINRAMERMGIPIKTLHLSIRHIELSAEGNTGIFNVTVVANQPVFASNLANMIAEEYAALADENRYDFRYVHAIGPLARRASEVRLQLRDAEERVLEIRSTSADMRSETQTELESLERYIPTLRDEYASAWEAAKLEKLQVTERTKPDLHVEVIERATPSSKPMQQGFELWGYHLKGSGLP